MKAAWSAWPTTASIPFFEPAITAISGKAWSADDGKTWTLLHSTGFKGVAL